MIRSSGMLPIRLLAAEPCDPLVANRSVPQIVYGCLLPPSTCRSAHGRRGHEVSRANPTPPARRPRAAAALPAPPPREDASLCTTMTTGQSVGHRLRTDRSIDDQPSSSRSARSLSRPTARFAFRISSSPSTGATTSPKVAMIRFGHAASNSSPVTLVMMSMRLGGTPI